MSLADVDRAATCTETPADNGVWRFILRDGTAVELDPTHRDVDVPECVRPGDWGELIATRPGRWPMFRYVEAIDGGSYRYTSNRPKNQEGNQ